MEDDSASCKKWYSNRFCNLNRHWSQLGRKLFTIYSSAYGQDKCREFFSRKYNVMFYTGAKSRYLSSLREREGLWRRLPAPLTVTMNKCATVRAIEVYLYI